MLRQPRPRRASSASLIPRIPGGTGAASAATGASTAAARQVWVLRDGGGRQPWP